MVFSGRPSTACEPCRKWRLRCDRAVPSCIQCMRKNIVCKGYRDPAQLRLRNETERVSLKHQPASQKQHFPIKASSNIQLSSDSSNAVSADKSGMSGKQSKLAWDATPLSLGTNAPNQPDHHLAISYFMNAFIISSPFEGYLPIMYSGSPTGSFKSAVRAAAFATLALRHKDARHMRAAISNYSRALVETNACLAFPRTAILDTTLAAVLLLGLFEAISFQGKESPESWTAHTLGAVQLLRLRGVQQFRSKIASQLFMQTMINIRTSYMQRAVAVPQQFVRLHEEAAPFLSPTDLSILIGPIIDRAASLRQRAIESPNVDHIFEALTLDGHVVDLSKGLEPLFHFTTRSEADIPPWAYLSTAHRYFDRRIAKFWNAIRMVRLFINDLIGRWVTDLGDDTRIKVQNLPNPPFSLDFIKNLQTLVKNNIAELELGILASVPEYIEVGGLGTRFSPSARTLIWPLTVIYRCRLCNALAKKYAVKFLDELGKDLNMVKAIEAVVEWNQMEDWSHLNF